jgi:hypothetical protein
MKLLKFLIIVPCLLITHVSFADIIDGGSSYSYQEKCAMVTNLSEYPEISLVAVNYSFYGEPESVNIVKPGECVVKSSNNYRFEVYAVRNDYIAGKRLMQIDWGSDKNTFRSSLSLEAASYTSIHKTENYYKIVGFTETSVVLFKWKEVVRYNYRSADASSKETIFEYDENMPSLMQQIPLGVHSQSIFSNIKVYPNPTKGTFRLGPISDSDGDIRAELYNANGKLLKIYRLEKNAGTAHFFIDASDQPADVYFLKIHFGEISDVRKVVIF